jgi:acyl-CoA synthetase (AMP-forming)/AMP-acid ligase II
MSSTGGARQMGRMVGTLVRSRMLAPMRPDKYLRMGTIMRTYGPTATASVALAANRCPDKPAMIDELGSLTWGELDARCSALAVGLAADGPAPRTVAILCRNHRGFAEGLYAAGRLGADALLLNTAFAGPQLADVVERESPDVLIYDEEFEAVVAPALERRPQMRTVLAWVDGDTDRTTVEGLIAAHRGRSPEPPATPGRIVLLTSGTTGAPKGARRPGGGGLSALTGTLERIPWKAEESIVVAAPMFHAWGFGQLVLGATMACTVVTQRRFDPEATLEMVARHRATGLAVVPVMLERIVDLPEDVRRKHDTSSLRYVTASGSRMNPSALLRFMDAFGDVVYNSYNATEIGMVACATPADLRAAPTTAGRPFMGVEVLLLGDDDQEVPPGEVGRILVRSISAFEGYTSGDARKSHGDYMESGDVGYLDESGRLHVVGRDDEMIVSGGENVYPREVEETLTAHEQVREAAVVGVDDEQFGQRLVAFVALQTGATATAEDLKQHVREHLARYKVPRQITVLDELPRNAAGKVVTRDLVERSG